MAHAIARRHRRRRSHRRNPFLDAIDRWHRLDGKYSRRAGGRYLRKVRGHSLRHNPRRRHHARHSRSLSRLFANPFRARVGGRNRWFRKHGGFSKRAGGGRGRKWGRRKLYRNNPVKRRRRHTRRYNLAHYNQTKKRGRKKGARKGKRGGSKKSRKAAGLKAAATRAQKRRERVLMAYALGAQGGRAPRASIRKSAPKSAERFRGQVPLPFMAAAR